MLFFHNLYTVNIPRPDKTSSGEIASTQQREVRPGRKYGIAVGHDAADQCLELVRKCFSIMVKESKERQIEVTIGVVF